MTCKCKIGQIELLLLLFYYVQVQRMLLVDLNEGAEVGRCC